MSSVTPRHPFGPIAFARWLTSRAAPLLGAFWIGALWSSRAVASDVTVQVECAVLDADAAAAFEARTRAELAVRAASGKVQLSCAGGTAVLLWRPASGAARSLNLPEGELQLDRLLEALGDLLGSGEPEPEVSRPTVVTGERRPEEAKADGTNAPPSESRRDAEPPRAAGAPRAAPPRPARASTESEREGAGPEAASADLPGDDAPRARPMDSLTESQTRGGLPPFSLRAGAALSLLGAAPAAGVHFAAAVEVSKDFEVLLEGTGQQALTGTEDFLLRIGDARVGTSLGFAPGWSAFALIGAGRLLVRAPATHSLSNGVEGCSFDGRNGSCDFLGASAGLSWSWLESSLRPELVARLDWNHRRVPIEDLQADGASNSIAGLPHLRPMLIARLAWSPNAPRDRDARSVPSETK